MAIRNNRLAKDVQNAEQRLDANPHQQGTKNDAYEILYKLASAAQLAGATTISLKAEITKISDDFDTTFNDVTDSQEKVTEERLFLVLYRGLRSG
ncbi:MAG: hypothetical protein Q9176_003873 [Flavoplaca citrina]